MQAFLFYMLYPLIYLVASLPFRLLYVFSDGLYYLLKWSGYRKDVVLQNLRNSFPEKSETEIKVIAEAYFRFLCDLILETFKTIRIKETQVRERCRFISTDWFDQYYKENRSIVAVMGHYGNWEWAGPGFSLGSPYQLIVIYKPLSNVYFERLMVKMRTRFGTKITPMAQVLREMVTNRNNVTVTAFIADQTASPETAHWMTFLNQDSAVFTGTEKLAVKFKYPVVFMNVKRVKRGYYEIRPELLFEHPDLTGEGEISEAFMKRLEKEIKNDPAVWLWSHKRWKHKRTNVQI